MMQRSVTLRDVAELAGVSVATVSRVVNRSAYVSPELRRRVESAHTQLGYCPNAIARSLRTSRSKVIGILTNIISNPKMPALAEGIEAIASEAGYSVVLTATKGNVDAEDEYAKLLRSQFVEGLIIDSVMAGSYLVRQLLEDAYPFVLASRRLEDIEANYVGMDNKDAMFQSIRYLHNLGHVRIGYICGDLRSSVCHEHLIGYQETLANLGISFDPGLVVSGQSFQGSYTTETGSQAIRRLMSLLNPPTAIVSISDIVAFGAWRWLRRNGFQVPRDVSLIGYGNTQAASLGPVGLTTVDTNNLEMGRIAAEVLIQEIEGERDHFPVHTSLPVELVVRDTCAPPPRRAIEDGVQA